MHKDESSATDIDDRVAEVLGEVDAVINEIGRLETDLSMIVPPPASAENVPLTGALTCTITHTSSHVYSAVASTCCIGISPLAVASSGLRVYGWLLVCAEELQGARTGLKALRSEVAELASHTQLPAEEERSEQDEALLELAVMLQKLMAAAN